MKLIVNLHLLELEWNHMKDVKRKNSPLLRLERKQFSTYNNHLYYHTTTPMKNQLVDDGQVETLDTSLSTSNKTDKYVCVPTNAD